MAQYLPPSENLPIFDDSVFQVNNTPLTYSDAIKHFLTYPRAQGKEYLQEIEVEGVSTFNQNLIINDGSNITVATGSGGNSDTTFISSDTISITKVEAFGDPQTTTLSAVAGSLTVNNDAGYSTQIYAGRIQYTDNNTNKFSVTNTTAVNFVDNGFQNSIEAIDNSLVLTTNVLGSGYNFRPEGNERFIITRDNVRSLAPLPAVGDNSDKVATTQFVFNELADGVPNISVTNSTANTQYTLPLITSTATGSYPPYAGGTMTYNPSTSTLTVPIINTAGNWQIPANGNINMGKILTINDYANATSANLNQTLADLSINTQTNSSNISLHIGTKTALLLGFTNSTFNTNVTNTAANWNIANATGAGTFASVSATTFTGALSGNASTATTATNSNNASTTTTNTQIINLVGGITNATTYQPLYMASSLPLTYYTLNGTLNCPIITTSTSVSSPLLRTNANGLIRVYDTAGTLNTAFQQLGNNLQVSIPAGGGLFKMITNGNGVLPTATAEGGTGFGWNVTSGGGESTIINYQGAGTTGNFDFYNVASATNSVKIATITKTQPALTDRSTNLATTAWTLGSLANQTPLTSSFSLVNGVVNFNNAYSGVAVMTWNSAQTTIAAWTFSNPQLYVSYIIFLTTATAVTINKPTTGGCISNLGGNVASAAGAKWKIDVVWDGTNYYMDINNYT